MTRPDTTATVLALAPDWSVRGGVVLHDGWPSLLGRTLHRFIRANPRRVAEQVARPVVWWNINPAANPDEPPPAEGVVCEPGFGWYAPTDELAYTGQWTGAMIQFHQPHPGGLVYLVNPTHAGVGAILVCDGNPREVSLRSTVPAGADPDRQGAWPDRFVAWEPGPRPAAPSGLSTGRYSLHGHEHHP